jgi:hypothetical protein
VRKVEQSFGPDRDRATSNGHHPDTSESALTAFDIWPDQSRLPGRRGKRERVNGHR